MKKQLMAIAILAMIAWVPPVRTLFWSMVTVASQAISHWLVSTITHTIAR